MAHSCSTSTETASDSNAHCCHASTQQKVETSCSNCNASAEKAPSPPPTSPSCCCSHANHANDHRESNTPRCNNRDCRQHHPAVFKIRSPFVSSAFIGFSLVVLLRNVFMLMSTIGLTTLALLTLGKRGIVDVNWQKLQDSFHLPGATLKIKVPSKAGLATGLFLAWKFWC
ncbi:hypothetical protein AeMF1_011596 [Aphanomyces euteiches]|nr:hypothetical protein AeMF1_011596 [Aphanomyces euteiches]KAH9194656.1 hypothetical protein AeNC1_003371 [Aphanomyces euteiches]